MLFEVIKMFVKFTNITNKLAQSLVVTKFSTTNILLDNNNLFVTLSFLLRSTTPPES